MADRFGLADQQLPFDKVDFKFVSRTVYFSLLAWWKNEAMTRSDVSPVVCFAKGEAMMGLSITSVAKGWIAVEEWVRTGLQKIDRCLNVPTLPSQPVPGRHGRMFGYRPIRKDAHPSCGVLNPASFTEKLTPISTVEDARN